MPWGPGRLLVLLLVVLVFKEKAKISDLEENKAHCKPECPAGSRRYPRSALWTGSVCRTCPQNRQGWGRCKAWWSLERIRTQALSSCA